jgi:hypothetical protein
MVNDKFFEEIDPADTLEVMKQKMEYRINHTIEQTNRTVKAVRSGMQPNWWIKPTWFTLLGWVRPI